MRLSVSIRVLWFATTLVLGGTPWCLAQVNPNEILNPDLKALEKQYFPELKSLHQEIARMHFPFPFFLSRYVGLEPAKQAEADSRGLEFVKFRDRTVLKTTGNYNAAYDSSRFTRNERAARTFTDVILPVLKTITKTMPTDVGCDVIGFEVAYHTRAVEKSYDYEGKEQLVIVLDRQDAFLIAQTTNDTARQDILNRSMIFLGGEEFGLSLLDKDPLIVTELPRTKGSKADATSTARSSTSASRLKSSNSNLLPPSGVGGDVPVASSAKPDLSQAKPAATAADAERLQAQYQAQLEVLSKEGQARFQFVDYDPPAFVVIGKQLALQMTLRNTLRFDTEKSSIYKRAAQTFDLFLAPKLKDILEKLPEDAVLDVYDFAVVNPLASAPGAKERSEAIEFVFPKTFARQFTNSEITNQALIDKSQVLINGVRIALNLQLVE